MLTFEDTIDDYSLVVEERFEGPELGRDRWFPFYLPHWSGRDRARANYHLGTNRLELSIAEDQSPWLPDLIPDMRVSSLQTGSYAGPIGSTVGQHRTHQAMRVVERQPVLRLITPKFAAVDLRAHWHPHDDYMVAFWMIGFEENPNESGEICVCEMFGSEASSRSALVGAGIHPFADPNLTDDFEKIRLPINVGETHDYAVVWTPEDVTFYVDGQPIKHSAQSPQYPMQLMLGIYDFGGNRANTAQPFIVERVRVHQVPA